MILEIDDTYFPEGTRFLFTVPFSIKIGRFDMYDAHRNYPKLGFQL